MLLISLSLLRAQQPARDTPVQPAAISGTASVVGTVMYDEVPPHPVRRAAVTVTNVENNRAVRTYTDDAGQFALNRLPAGRFILSALKAGQVTFTYGSPRPGLSGSAVVLTDGQTFSAGTLKMTRGAVITGMVLGAMGRPMPGVFVSATPFQVVAGERRAIGNLPPSSATTDDRGIYRIYGLTPATYMVSVATRFANTGDMAQPTEAEYRFAAAPPGAGPPPAPGPSVVFAPVIFPGVADEASALPVTVSAGEERSGIDIQLKLLATAKVSGTLVGGSGSSMISAVRMFAQGGSVLGDQMNLGSANQGALDGSFAIPGVPPGSYRILAGAAELLPGGGPPQNPSLWAMVDLQVMGKDVTGLTLTLQPTLSVSGTVVFSGAQKPVDGTRTTLSLRAATPQQLFPGGNGVAGADGAFTIGGVIPGSYRVQTFVGQPGWLPKSAMLNGKDAFDVPIDIRPGADVSGLVVTMTDRLAEITGTIVDGKGAPVPRFYVQAFPADQTMWLPGSRRVKNSRASTDGSFSISGLPAGDYYLCALTEYDPAMASDPSFLAQLVPASIKITLADGEKKTQVLKLAGAGGFI